MEYYVVGHSSMIFPAVPVYHHNLFLKASFSFIDYFLSLDYSSVVDDDIEANVDEVIY